MYSLAPSERTQYLMLGTYVAQESYQEIKNSVLMDKVSKMIEYKIDSLLNEESTDKK